MPQHILELVAENLKKLRVVQIGTDGKRLIQITGRNGAGKSSVLDAIWFALKGQKMLPANKATMVRRGAEKMRVELKIDGENQAYTITRTLGTEGNPPTLSIVPAVHRDVAKTPQEYLDDLFGALTFDPLEFVRMSREDQIAELKKTAKVDLDFDDFAAKDEADFIERGKVNREVKLLDGQIAGMRVLEGLPKEKLDTEAIVTQLNEAAEANRQAQEIFKARQDLGVIAANIGLEKMSIRRRIDQKETDLAKLEKLLEQQRGELAEFKNLEEDTSRRHKDAEKLFQEAPAGIPVDVMALTAELRSAESTNRAIDQRATFEILKADRAEKQRKSDHLTRTMEQRAEKKREALAKAQIPVPGLTFDEREVKFNGIPLENLGEGEQIRISTLIGMAANPKLRVLCIRHGEALDEDGLKLLAEMAAEHDFQIWMARVDSSGKVGIVMEDGSVARTNDE